MKTKFAYSTSYSSESGLIVSQSFATREAAFADFKSLSKRKAFVMDWSFAGSKYRIYAHLNHVINGYDLNILCDGMVEKRCHYSTLKDLSHMIALFSSSLSWNR